jgi:hypothetical protein
MPGLRIHHPTERNCTLLVHHPGEIKSFMKTRNKGRGPKDYHIRLDNDGNCIVSTVVWERLQEAGANFIVLNEVADPPAQILGMNDSSVEIPAVKREINKAIVDISPPGMRVYVTEHHG